MRQESADTGGFTGAPWANPVSGQAYKFISNIIWVCVTKKKNPFGEDLRVPPEPSGPVVPSFEFRCVASPDLKKKKK